VFSLFNVLQGDALLCEYFHEAIYQSIHTQSTSVLGMSVFRHGVSGNITAILDSGLITTDILKAADGLKRSRQPSCV
jgi:hypothetical protein